jgi:hypothetical protein
MRRCISACSQLPPVSDRRLASQLDRNSTGPCGAVALASSFDALGALDKRPVHHEHASGGAFLDRERFTPSRFLDGNPTVQLKRYREGEPSLSGEPECLSLQGFILARQVKTANGGRRFLPQMQSVGIRAAEIMNEQRFHRFSSSQGEGGNRLV